MELIYYTLIEDEDFKINLTTNIYKTLRNELIKIIFPLGETVVIFNKFNNLKKQNSVQ